MTSPGDPSLDPGERLGPYEIEARIGGGGRDGLVYRARYSGLDERHALRVLPAPMRGKAALRFVEETELLCRLPRHLGLINVRTAGLDEDRGLVYLGTDLCDGEPLARRLRHGSLGEREAVRITQQAARAVGFLQRHHVHHLDVQPGSVMVGPSDEVRLREPAKVRESMRGEPVFDTSDAPRSFTFAWLAPEVIRGQLAACTERTDVYGLGTLLYAALTGVWPGFGTMQDQPFRLFEMILMRGPPAPRELVPEIDPALERICLRALAIDPDERHARPAELHEQLALWVPR